MDAIVLRILDLVEQSGLTDKKIVEKSEISKTAISDWRKGKARPSSDAIIKLAAFFHVSTDYLLTGSERLPELSCEDSEWLSLLHRLPPEQRPLCFSYMEGFLNGLSARAGTQPNR